jgi:hypothetical protein
VWRPASGRLSENVAKANAVYEPSSQVNANCGVRRDLAQPKAAVLKEPSNDTASYCVGQIRAEHMNTTAPCIRRMEDLRENRGWICERRSIIAEGWARDAWMIRSAFRQVRQVSKKFNTLLDLHTLA